MNPSIPAVSPCNACPICNRISGGECKKLCLENPSETFSDRNLKLTVIRGGKLLSAQAKVAAITRSDDLVEIAVHEGTVQNSFEDGSKVENNELFPNGRLGLIRPFIRSIAGEFLTINYVAAQITIA